MGDPLSNTKVVVNLFAQTATVTDNISYNPSSADLALIVRTANRASTGTWTPKLQMVLPDPLLLGQASFGDPLYAYLSPTANPTFVDLWIAAAAIAANGTFVYQLSGQTAPSTTQITEGKALLLPPVYRWVFTYGGAGAFDLLAFESFHED